MGEFKRLFMEELKHIVGDSTSVAVPLSSGMDSRAVLFGLLEMGLQPVTYSFAIQDRKTLDSEVAKEVAKVFKVENIRVDLPKVLDIPRMKHLIKHHHSYKKVDVECFYPYTYLFDRVEEDIVISGNCAGGHFCNSKKASIHFKHSIELLRRYRASKFSNPNYSQTRALKEYAAERSIKYDTPFFSTSIYKYFHEKSWASVNKPKQKQPILDMFPEQFSKSKVYPATNLQCGDSGIRELFEPLLKSRLNVKRRKNLMWVYKDIYQNG